MFSFFNFKDMVFMVLKALLPKLFSQFKTRNDKSAEEIAQDLKDSGVVTRETVAAKPVEEAFKPKMPEAGAVIKYPRDQDAESTTSNNEHMPTESDPMWAAFDKLESSNKAHWAYYGQKRQRPDLDVIDDFLGRRPKLAEMTASWKAYKAASN